MRRNLWMAIGLLVFAAHAARAADFRVDELRVGGRIHGVMVEDLNADGKRELLVLYAIGKAPVVRHRLAIFWGKETLSPRPDVLLDVPRGASFVDVGDVDQDKKRALIFFEGRTATVSRLDPATNTFYSPVPWLTASNVMPIADERYLPFWDLCKDWDGDGTEELLLPTFDRILVFKRVADAWKKVTELRLSSLANYQVRDQMYDPRVKNFSSRVEFTIPELVSIDFDGDGKLDLGALVEDYVQAHKGGVDTVFSPAAMMRINLGLRSDHELLRNSAHLQTHFADLDKDGIADLVATKITGGLSSMKTNVSFYYGKRGGGFDHAEQSFQVDGYSGAATLGDANGDGKPDLLLPHVTVGLSEMARVLMSKKMTVSFGVHRNQGRKFSSSADVTHDIDYSVDYSVVAELDGPYPSMAGDFNGDGRADLVAPKGAGTLAIWLGDAKNVMSEDARYIIKVPTSKQMLVVDFEGDKRSDLVLFQRARGDSDGSLHVVRNLTK